MKYMTKKHTLLAITLASLTLTACGKNDTVKVDNKPAKLVKLEQQQKQLSLVADYNVSAVHKAQALRLRIESEQGIDFVINPKGIVTAYKGKSRLWETKVSKRGLSAGVEVAEGVVAVANLKGELFALDANNGQILWRAELGSSVLAPSLIQMGRVITITNDGTVYAHDVKSGQQLWAYKLPHNQFGLRGQAAPISADGRSVVVTGSNGHIVVIDGVSGMAMIQRRVAVSDGRSEINRVIDIDGEPLLIGSLLITTSYQGQLTVTDLNQQRTLWSEDVSSRQSPASDQEKVYVSRSNGYLTAYDLVSGRVIWSNEQLANRKLSNPVLLDGYIIVGDLEGVLHIVNPESGDIIGRAKTKGGVSYLYVDDNKLYASTHKGEFSVWKF